jgi:capsular exopolysaccharide synthesis family protein
VRQSQIPSTEQIAANPELMPQPGIAVDGDAFGRFLQFLKKRIWIVGVALALGCAIAMVVNATSKRQYTAIARVEIVPDRSEEFRVSSAQGLGSAMDDAEKLDTEIEVLKSRSMALRVINTLHLNANSDFMPLQGGKPWDLSDVHTRQTLIGALQGTINIQRRGHTSILDITVVSGKPALASLIANTIVDAYIERTFQDNFNATMRISGWLSGELNNLKGNLQKSQNQMIDYQRDLGLVGTDPKDSVMVATLEEMNRQLADAEINRTLKEAQLKALKNSEPDVLDATSGTDPGLQMARQQLTQLRSQYSSLAQTYGSAYPPLKALGAQIEQVESTKKVMEAAQRERAQKELDAAVTNENMLRARMNAQEQKVYGNGEKGAQLAFARSEYEANRLLYDGLQQRLQEAGIMAGLHSTSIHVIDSADLPTAPSSPRTRFNLMLGGGIGMLIGVVLALLLEAMDTNLKTMTDIERTLQLPLLAAIPEVDTENLLPSKFKEHAVAKGSSSWSRIAEAMRGMRTSILLSSPGAPPKVLMITSTRPAEGKSSVSTLMAITFALNGSKVLLIDSDLRRPSVHLRFRMGKGLGLSSVLSGKADFKEAITPWPDLPSLHIMTSGPVPPLPSELLGSRQMEDLIESLRSEYDFVLIDTPPVLAVTDASILARLTDAAILIIRYGAAQRHVVQRCIDMLDRSSAHLLGVAVNAVNFNAPEYSEYYGRKYYEYYGERSQE